MWATEQLIEIDKQDNVIGPIERLRAHLGEGVPHRGLMVAAKDYRNRIYITERIETRRDLNFPATFPRFWDVTIAGHPKWGQTDYLTQMLAELEEELQIKVETEELQWLGKFEYKAPDPTYPNSNTPSNFRITEHEICGAALLHTHRQPSTNPHEIARAEWVEAYALRSQVNSKAKKFTPWAVDALTRYPEIYEHSPPRI